MIYIRYVRHKNDYHSARLEIKTVNICFFIYKDNKKLNVRKKYRAFKNSENLTFRMIQQSGQGIFPEYMFDLIDTNSVKLEQIPCDIHSLTIETISSLQRRGISKYHIYSNLN